MIKHYLLLSVFLLFSCTASPQKNESFATDTTNNTEQTSSVTELVTWEEKQFFLRDSILKAKPNEILKSDFFQEFYIRDIVEQEGNSITFNLPFNLHAFDCGAPDCYTTTLSFAIPIEKVSDFPKTITCQFYEEGCITEKPTSKNIEFVLIENSKTYINYYSDKENSNLVLIGDKQNSAIYYFTDVKANTIKVNLIDKILEEYDEENPNAIIPYRIWRMETNEYENFL
ncbi:hypothetical protein [Bernardetia sp.]|uniref:hypothetical protein n=1 Tax=Bernardetia sp. TaxID=1937974 RepID=UPI0025B9FB67|nr:hypothetical protein [Bernardetia sp.]